MPSSKVHLKFIIDLNFQEKASLIGMNIEDVISMEDEREKILIGSKVRTGFRLAYETPIKKEGETIDLDEKFWVTMLSLSLSHVRAITARSTNGTLLQNLVLPIVNPGTIFENTIKKDLVRLDSEA